jgi:hypothetical protein
MIGSFLSINRIFEHKPLIIPTIYKAVLFTLWVMIFDIAWGLYDYNASPMYVAFPRCHLLSVSDIVFFEGYDPYGGSLYNPTPSLINPGGVFLQRQGGR